jgi:phosphopantetheinyl transferase
MELQLLEPGMLGLCFDNFSLEDLNYRSNGKPAATDGAGFSISHAAGLFACVVGEGERACGLTWNPKRHVAYPFG